MAKIDFGGVVETVVTRKEYPLKKAQKVLKDEVIAIIGYGVQGPAQALNMKDNGINVIIGQSKKFPKDWDRAVKDGWVPGKTLFEIDPLKCHRFVPPGWFPGRSRRAPGPPRPPRRGWARGG